MKKRKPGRPKGFAIALPTEEIIRAYEGGASIRKLAKEFDVSYHTVRTRLLGWGVELRPIGNPTSARVGNRGGSNPGAESNPGPSESPTSHVDSRRRQILELEAKVAEGELTLKLAHELKQAYEKELAIIKGVPAR